MFKNKPSFVVLVVALIFALSFLAPSCWSGGNQYSEACTDQDLDGRGAGCVLGLDCDDSDPYNWLSCATCIDADADGYRGTGCDIAQDCDDGDPYNWSSCTTCIDADADGYGGAGCDINIDCDDGYTGIYPGAVEIYGDGIDQDCDGRDPDQFLINPYLQLGNQASSPQIKNRLTVCWENGSPTTGRVLYGATLPLSNQVLAGTSAMRHEVEINGLKPDTRYFYQVIAGSSTGPLATFTTAPSDLHKPFNFAVVADTRTRHSVHQAVIDMARAWHPAFYLHGGDQVENGGDPSLWLNFFQIEKNLAAYSVLAPVNGNHEMYGGSGPYQRYFSLPLNLTSDEMYYSWDYGNIHFIATSSEVPSATQDAAIFADLAAASASYPNPRFIVVHLHRNAYTNDYYDNSGNPGYGHQADENYAYSTIWGPEFEQHNVALVLQAHCHQYERFEPIASRTPQGDPPGNPDIIRNGVTYVTTGASGAPIAGLPPPPGFGGGGTPHLDSLVAGSTTHAMRIDVDNGLMHIRVYRLSDQSLLDEFSIIRNLAPVANAGSDFSATAGTSASLNGAASSDPESDTLTFQWQQTSGPAVTLNNPTTATPDFTPGSTGTYTFQVTVSDGLDSSTDSVIVTVN